MWEFWLMADYEEEVEMYLEIINQVCLWVSGDDNNGGVGMRKEKGRKRRKHQKGWGEK